VPKRRDDHPGEELLGWLIGGVVGYFMGRSLGQRIAEKQRVIIEFPDTLEIDPGKVYIPPDPTKERRRREQKRAVLFLGLWFAGCAVITLGIGVNGLNDLPDSAIVLGMVAGGIALVSWLGYYRLGWKPKSEEFKVDPLDFSEARVYTVALPRTTSWQPQKAGGLMQDVLLKLGGRATFQIVAEEGRIVWRVIDLRRALSPEVITHAIHAFYPNAEITCDKLPDVFSCSIGMSGAFNSLTRSPILRVEALILTLVGLTHEMSTLNLGSGSSALCC
jgi:hypothetical protein